MKGLTAGIQIWTAMVLIGSFCYAGDEVAELGANEWVKITDSSLIRGGPGRVVRGPALLYVPPLDKFLAALGVQNRFDRKTPCYSETMLSLDEQVWKNWYPKGKNWGPETGPADKVPTINDYGRGLKKDKEGVLRPHLRGSYGMPVWHQYCWDPERKKAVFLFADKLIQYDPVERVWSRLPATNSPAEPNLPGVSVDGGSHIHWSALCYDPVNRELLLFGGASTITERGDPGTQVYSFKEQKWRKLDPGSKQMNQLHDAAIKLKSGAQAMVAGCRNRYYHTERAKDKSRELSDILQERLNPAHIEKLLKVVKSWGPKFRGHERKQAGWAVEELGEALDLYKSLLASIDRGVAAEKIKTARKVRALLRRASISLASQPPQRCYSPMVFDPKTQKIVLFGGNHLDRCLADTWIYDPKTRTWEERRPEVSPAPRHCHGMLYLPESGKIALVGGWRTKLQDHPALPMEAWTYDVAANKWQLVKRWGKEAPSRRLLFRGAHCNSVHFATDRNDVVVMQHYGSTWACSLDASVSDKKGTEEHGVPPKTEEMIAAGKDEYSPEWYDSAPVPDPAAMKETLAGLPVNKWVVAPQGGRHRPKYAYGTMAYDSQRDEILLWGGGHATTHQTVVSRYSLATGRWHIDYPPQLPMSYGRRLWGQNYAYGYRPFMPRHPWNGYGYDPPSGKLLICRTTGPLMLTFNPDIGDFEKPRVTLPPHGGEKQAAVGPSPDGALLWAERILYRFDHEKNEWEKLDVKGASLPKTKYYDSVVYDSKRKKYVLFRGRSVYVYDPADSTLKHMQAENRKAAPGFVREIKYIPGEDIFLHGMGQYWDPAENKWGKLNFDCTILKKVRVHGFSNDAGMCWDPRRKLLWIVKGKGLKVFVLKPDFATARAD